MSKRANPEQEASAEATERSAPAVPEAVESTEVYETEEGTVFYDAQNPLAWLQSDVTMPLDEIN